jgi:hypothetical protein
MDLSYYFEYYHKHISQDTDAIRRTILKNIKPYYKNNTISVRLVTEAFKQIDHLWFHDTISKKLQDINKPLKFYVSGKLKCTAGYVQETYTHFKIKISTCLLENLFSDTVKSVEISGLMLPDVLTVLIVLLEHELTHLVIMLLKNHPLNIIKEKSGHTQTFKTLVRNMYGHTKVTHSLLLGDIEQHNKVSQEIKSRLDIGDQVFCKKNKATGKIVDIRGKMVVIKAATAFKGCLFKDLEVIKKTDNPNLIEDIKKSLSIGTLFHYGYKQYRVKALNPTTFHAEDLETGKVMVFKYWAFVQ